MKFTKVNPLQNAYLESLGFSWHTDLDGSPYLEDRLVCVSQREANAYYEAANELYDMYVKAAQYAIDNDLLGELGIPFNLREQVVLSFNNDVHWQLYGRFDLAGGLDGKPIKLIEFNSDTPTSLFESAILQWALLKQNGMDESKQFNNAYEAIMDNFKRLVMLDGDIDEFDKNYEGWRILFSCIDSNNEELITTRFLEHLAREAGFRTDFAYIDKVEFSKDGVFANEQNYEFLFKLIPWEDIAIEEGELAALLTQIIKEQKAIIINPAYTLLFQSKAMLKLLWQLFPSHPLLVKASLTPLQNTKQVCKRAFGREGANIQIIDNDGKILSESKGPYDNHLKVYQEFVEFNKDEVACYQAGVFYAYEACALGFRKGGLILNDEAKFLGHIIT